MARPVSLASLVLVVGCILPAGVAVAGGFDVSYVWARNLDNVQAYKEKVARVLGPHVARQLRVVHKSHLYGVIYDRRGDREGAAGVARAHSRLLQAKGLDPAAPIRADDWSVVGARSAETPDVGGSSSWRFSGAERPPAAGDLSAAVDRQVKAMRQQGLIAADERTAWSVYDFTTGRKLVSINEDIQFQAASMIKPFVALAFFHQSKQGGLIYGPKSRRHMERMIRYSSNSSTNWLMRQLGGPAGVQRILKHDYPGIFADTSIVEYIPAGGRTYRNKASARDYSRFLYALWNESVPGAGEIKRLMGMTRSNRLYTGAEAIPEGTQVYNKTGSTAMLCGDIGILVVKGQDGRDYPYTLVGIIEKDHRAANYTSWIRSRGDVIRQISSLVYTGISRQHSLQPMLADSGDS
ncbi:MAG TPA: serine hydrolase [Arenicellales bacterium]|nr:serine hydrolase [Arenicellales bacterium]